MKSEDKWLVAVAAAFVLFGILFVGTIALNHKRSVEAYYYCLELSKTVPNTYCQK